MKELKSVGNFNIVNKVQVLFYQKEKFLEVMKMHGVTEENILESFDFESNIKEMFQSGEGSGRSGSFFFTTQDKKFMIKTLRGEEKDVILKSLDAYI